MLPTSKTLPELNSNKLKIIIFLGLIPSLAIANAGSPMMWFGILHSLVLNLLIGIYESEYLEKKEIPNRMWIIVGGNYFSMIVGLYFIAPYFSSITGNIDFWGGNTRFGDYELTGFVFGMLASFISTLILEFPFYFLSVKDKTKRKKGIGKYILTNTISNAIIFLIYLIIIFRGSK
ncbi:hypothetical protein [Aquimarina aquimarini]|uniref:hypothetical protein n=1 Tax=Aquimarina aquimarini TaxID=1191734 RepID=UPI001F3C2B34|nr:hypothetical protein [Aquimarina aquimarini]